MRNNGLSSASVCNLWRIALNPQPSGGLNLHVLRYFRGGYKSLCSLQYASTASCVSTRLDGKKSGLRQRKRPTAYIKCIHMESMYERLPFISSERVHDSGFLSYDFTNQIARATTWRIPIFLWKKWYVSFDGRWQIFVPMIDASTMN